MILNINYEHKMRLKFNQRAYSKAYKSLLKAVQNGDDYEIYTSIGELLLWILNAHEWHKKHGKNDYTKRLEMDEKGALILGLNHAFNSLKHNMKFFIIHKKQAQFSFKNIDFTEFDFRPQILTWINSVNAIDEARYEDNLKNYIKYLEGKEVISSFSDVLTFLNLENQHIFFSKD